MRLIITIIFLLMSVAPAWGQYTQPRVGVGGPIGLSLTSATLQDGSSFTGTDVAMSTVWQGVFIPSTAADSIGMITFRIKNSAAITNSGTANYLQFYFAPDDGSGGAVGVPGKPVSTGRNTLGKLYYAYLNTGNPGNAPAYGTYAEYLIPFSKTVTAGANGYWLVMAQAGSPPTGGTITFDSTTGTNYGVTSANGTDGSWSYTTARLYYKIKGKTNIALDATSDTNYPIRGTSTGGVTAVYGRSYGSAGGGTFESVYGIGNAMTSIYGTGQYTQVAYGIAGFFKQAFPISGDVTTNVMEFQRIPTGTGSATGNIIYVNDSPSATGTHSGSVLKADIASSTRIDMNPRVADGASAIGYTLDTASTLSTAGARLMSLKTGGTEKAFINADGSINPGTCAFSALAGFIAPAGSFKWCTDCTAGTPCTGTGSGKLAVSTGAAWNCY